MNLAAKVVRAAVFVGLYVALSFLNVLGERVIGSPIHRLACWATDPLRPSRAHEQRPWWMYSDQALARSARLAALPREQRPKTYDSAGCERPSDPD